jgi:hypothetical protein
MAKYFCRIAESSHEFVAGGGKSDETARAIGVGRAFLSGTGWRLGGELSVLL